MQQRLDALNKYRKLKLVYSSDIIWTRASRLSGVCVCVHAQMRILSDCFMPFQEVFGRQTHKVAIATPCDSFDLVVCRMWMRTQRTFQMWHAHSCG